MKNLIRQISLVIFVLFCISIGYMHFSSLGKIPNACSSIEDEVERRSCEWHEEDMKERRGHVAAKRKQGLKLLNDAEREERSLDEGNF